MADVEHYMSIPTKAIERKIASHLMANGNRIDSYDLANFLTKVNNGNLVSSVTARSFLESFVERKIMDYASNQDPEMYADDHFRRAYVLRRDALKKL